MQALTNAGFKSFYNKKWGKQKLVFCKEYKKFVGKAPIHSFLITLTIKNLVIRVYDEDLKSKIRKSFILKLYSAIQIANTIKETFN